MGGGERGRSVLGERIQCLKNRGIENILFAAADDLNGMAEALESAFPQTLHQTGIVHPLRSSRAFVSSKDRKTVCEELKSIYQAVDAEAAERALEAFEASAMGKRCPAIAEAWAPSLSAGGAVLSICFRDPQAHLLGPTRSKGSTAPSARLSKLERCFPTKQPPIS